METPGLKVQAKFSTVFLSADFDCDETLDELISWCARFNDCGLCPSYGQGSFGNLSYRAKSGFFVITASGLELKGQLTKNDFVLVEKVDHEKFTVYCRGLRVPSSESPLHGAVYARRPDVNAIFHGHCQDILEKSERYACTRGEEAYGSRELVDRVLEILDNESFIIMGNHGFLSLGATMEAAGARAIREKTG